MYEIDADGMMEVEIGGVIHRRPAQINMSVFGASSQLPPRATPELRPGEILVEHIGRIPAIVRGAR